MSIATARIAGAAGMTMAGTPTIFTIRVDAASNRVFTIPAMKTSGSPIRVDWGDGSEVASYSPGGTNGWTRLGQVFHTYAVPGDYVVMLGDGLEYVAFGIRSASEDSPAMLMSIVQWGSGLFPDSVFEDSYLQILESNGITLFAGCSSLEGPLPSCPLARIGEDTFRGAVKLTDPSPLIGQNTVIDQAAFSFSGVTGTSWWPSGQTTVPANCFYGASRLASLSGLANVRVVQSSAFWGCTSLASLSGLASESTVAGWLTLSESCFEGCTSLASLSTLPRAVDWIPKRCFAGCTGLRAEGIRIPRQVTDIQSYAFADVGASEIVFGESVGPDGSIPLADQAHPTHIDQAAFVGQASAQPGGARPKLIAPHLSPSDFRGIAGTDALGGVTGGGYREVTVKYDDSVHSPTTYSWFYIMPTHQGYVLVSWAPWGVGPDWQIVTSASQDTPHADVICELFTGSTSGDIYLPEPLRNRNYGGSSTADWRTRLEVLQTIRPYVAQSQYAASFNFSPYADLRSP